MYIETGDTNLLQGILQPKIIIYFKRMILQRSRAVVTLQWQTNSSPEKQGKRQQSLFIPVQNNINLVFYTDNWKSYRKDKDSRLNPTIAW